MGNRETLFATDQYSDDHFSTTKNVVRENDVTYSSNATVSCEKEETISIPAPTITAELVF